MAKGSSKSKKVKNEAFWFSLDLILSFFLCQTLLKFWFNLNENWSNFLSECKYRKLVKILRNGDSLEKKYKWINQKVHMNKGDFKKLKYHEFKDNKIIV